MTFAIIMLKHRNLCHNKAQHYNIRNNNSQYNAIQPYDIWHHYE
jgi:hypothetical protein